jgi:hypothetical protein
MANPDTNSSNLVTGVPIAIFFLLITTFIFLLRDSISNFNFVLWITIPILSFVVASVVNIVSQYINCKTTNIGKAMLGAISSIIGVLISLFVASITWCRIPVATVFAPLFVGKSINITKNKSTYNVNSLKNNNSKECCLPKITIESIENAYPLIAGISHGFYVMFGMLFGIIIGTGVSSIC